MTVKYIEFVEFYTFLPIGNSARFTSKICLTSTFLKVKHTTTMAVLNKHSYKISHHIIDPRNSQMIYEKSHSHNNRIIFSYLLNAKSNHKPFDQLVSQNADAI